MSYLCVKGITAGYGRQNIIENDSFTLEAGCLLGIIGANGSGKTTLLKALCGILPHRGTCALEDEVLENLSPRQTAKLVSYIPQRSGISIDISPGCGAHGLQPQAGPAGASLESHGGRCHPGFGSGGSGR